MMTEIRKTCVQHGRAKKRTIAKAIIMRITLHSKTVCPCCGKNLLNAYDSSCSGCISIRCRNCGKPVLVDLDDGIALKIEDEHVQ